MTDEVKQGEVVYENIDKQDGRTGEIVPAGQPNVIPGILAQIEVSKVGTLELSKEAEASLDEPLNPEDVLIRPDGLVYLPWTWYNKRLNAAFGRLGWGLIPQMSPKIINNGNNTLVIWLNWLIVKGTPVSMAGGEMTYRSDNFTMSQGDAIEGARSNSLARNCKNLGIALELWDAEWVNTWRKKYAVQTEDSRGRKVWVKRIRKPKTEQAPDPDSPTPMVDELVAAGGEVKSVEPDVEVPVVVYSVRDLRNVPVIRKIGALRGGVKDSEIVKAIGELDKNKKYTVSETGEFVEYTE